MEDYQKQLFPYAYNILGSTEDAKDAVQEIVVKYHLKSKKSIENETGYLIRSVINESINLKKKLQRSYADSMWLPEPVFTDSNYDGLDSSEIISYSMLVLLEKLSSKERAVFMLREAFDYSHQEIAAVLNLTLQNSRKLLSRAKLKLEGYQSHRKAISTTNASKEFLQGYIRSIREGDVQSLEKLLSEDVSLAADGGGEIQVVRELTHGVTAAIKLLLYVYKTYQRQQQIEIGYINHQPALLYYEDSKLVNCQIFQISNGKIEKIFAQLTPDKLNAISET
ncbi:sigma-70 family RNA polymerase sigma factor [Muricauda sp. 2012CJ35-5]|uniref:Sigma-70 family RNA polymerase sigma factor n=1 Tax=Flagellimonas spongiicola TaxID=2942208 RepID=A0ABT0PWH3_9FLAO|nr:sigma-70 family RNA polymerase sigma factor [Allomuricauda spongiicola]MCL6275626.1 sigma-70 family RNA polymerase sigma factor [Allomuricauda spongiicola]